MSVGSGTIILPPFALAECTKFKADWDTSFHQIQNVL